MRIHAFEVERALDHPRENLVVREVGREPPQVVEEGRAAGFSQAEQWVDKEAGFALTRFSVV